MSLRPWLPGETRRTLKAILDQRVREREPAPPNPDSVTRAAYRRNHPEQERAWNLAYAARRKELRNARAAGSAEA